MPVVAVKLPEKLFRQIARLVADGAFETPGQFLETAAVNQLALEACPPPEAAPAKPRPGDERLWVQFNRVFGLKVACRWIACASAGAQTWPEVSVCTDAMASDVAELGSALERADAMAGRKRDELLATGLP